MESSDSDVTEAAAPNLALASYPPGYEYLRDVAVNPYGWSIPIPAGIDKYNLNYLIAEPLFGPATWQQGAKSMMEAGIGPWEAPFVSAARERSIVPDGAKHCWCILVGFGVAGLRPEHFKPPPVPPIRRCKASDPEDTRKPWVCHPIPIPNLASKRVFMVVARVTERQPKRANLYALLGPSNRLGGLYRIQTKECFYLPRFRIQTASFESRSLFRSKAWNILVQNDCWLPTVQAQISAFATQIQGPERPISAPRVYNLPQPALAIHGATDSQGCKYPLNCEKFPYHESQECLEPTNAHGNEEPVDSEGSLFGGCQDGLDFIM